MTAQGENKIMSQTQENLELPKIKLGIASGPEFTLTFKSETQKTQWIKEHKVILFSDNYLLLESHLCLCKIEQPETTVAPATKQKQTGRVS
jgi:hypothetical protein